MHRMKLKNVAKTLFLFSKHVKSAKRFRIPITVIVFIMLSMSDIVFNVFLLRYIVENYNSGLHFEIFLYIMFGVLLFQIVVWMLEAYYNEYYAEDSIQKVELYLKNVLYHKVDNISMEEFKKSHFYDKYFFVVENLKERIKGYFSLIEVLVSSLMMIVTLTGFIFITDPVLIFFILLPLVGEWLISPSLTKFISLKTKEVSNVERRLEYVERVMYLKQYSKEIRTTKVKHIILKTMDRFFLDMKYNIQYYGRKIGIRHFVIQYLFQGVAFFGILFYLVFRVKSGNVAIENAVVIVTTFNQTVFSFKNIMDLYITSVEQCEYLKDIMYFIGMYEDSSCETIEYVAVPKIIEKIEFKNVSFKYPNQEIYALRNINFEVKRGQKVAIIGANGAGKTTIMNLICRIYTPIEGEILINGININKFNFQEYKQRISLVRQHFVVFATTLEKNVLLREATNSEDRKRFVQAVKKSGFYDKYIQLSKGFKTIVTKEFDEEGESFSGGELQKIAIARTMAADADLMLLDEPSSALDPISEDKLITSLFDHVDDKLLFIVSHNMSYAKKSDVILFFENGKLMEIGCHDDLIQRDSNYSKYFKLQASYFK